ncbi:MAG: PD40 domain-containing protein [Acidobacteriota bacterium]|nr:PD40 domain-containing protein [Acidobacteriota bacterium]
MAQRSFFQRPAVLLVLALASVSGVVTVLGRLGGGGARQQKRVPVSGGVAVEAYPSLSGDGKRLAYSAREGKSGAWHVYVRALPAGTPLQVTRGEESDVAPVWSPDGGTLAFERIGEEKVEYVVIPADGGAERKAAEFAGTEESDRPQPGVAWTADGNGLVVSQTDGTQAPRLALVTLATGKVEGITKPPEASEGDSTPAVSPAGDTVAFVRGTGEGRGDVWVCDIRGGTPRRVTFDDHGARGIAWTRDGSELLYAANRTHGWQIWRVAAAGGSPREITIAGDHASYPAVAKSRLVFTESPEVAAIWRAELTAGGASGERLLFRSNGRESAPAYSPDGTRIATVSDETGAEEIFLQDADGGKRVQLTRMNRPRMGRPRWSGDGKQVIFEAASERGSEVYVLGVGVGAQPVRVAQGAGDPSFSRDGRSIYYVSRGEIWKAEADGKDARELVRRGGASPVESADGKWVLFRSGRSIFRAPAEGGDAEEFLVPDQDLFWTNIQATKTGIYYPVWERSARGVAVVFFDYAGKKNTVVMRSRGLDRSSGSFSVSPDGKSIVYAKVDREQTGLVMVEGFR